MLAPSCKDLRFGAPPTGSLRTGVRHWAAYKSYVHFYTHRNLVTISNFQPNGSPPAAAFL